MLGLALQRRLAPALTVGYLGLIYWLSSQTSPPVPSLGFEGADKLLHGIEYGGLGWLLAWSASAHGARGRAALFVGAVAGSLYGASDEIHQAFVPGRECDAFDWAADTFGSLVGALAFVGAGRWWAGRRLAAEGR